MENFTDYCKNYILDVIDNFVGQTFYTSDLSYELTKKPNVDGSLTFHNELAKNYIINWWDDASDYFDYEKDNFGEAQNPFTNPEAYMVCMVILGVDKLLAQCPIIEENWDDMVELTTENVNAIKNYINSLDDDFILILN